MKNSLLPHGGNDNIYTPDELALQIVRHFKPAGRCLDAARGTGAFFKAITEFTGDEPEWAETDAAVLPRGELPRDFLTHPFRGGFDWIITNPPYSKNLSFLKRAMELAKNVVFLVQATVPHFHAKRHAAEKAGFGLKETFIVPTPDAWLKQNGGPGKFGTGLAAVHWQQGWMGPHLISRAPGWEKGHSMVSVLGGCLAAISLILWLGEKLGCWA